MYPKDLRKAAIAMRKTGMSYRAIAEQMGIQPMTIRTWCKDVDVQAVRIDSLSCEKLEQDLVAFPVSTYRARCERLGCAYKTLITTAQRYGLAIFSPRKSSRRR